MTHIPPVLCSVADAARALGIGKTKTYALISDQLLDTVTIGSRRLVTVESIQRLVEKARIDEAA
ncbi:DNA binding domain-containing protein, excisionase family [Altererythrobacter xiamenensis]|uniref:DNA binding domain-containing protein, excisionase family n=1 Tax=Altererythrobacter xiamenensis TaxID=1316679 RepID=A0A1Y6FGJ9_9SPHN|nr:helix-turn-helix domain-containing protein [Altererythrobacter xiamenensis]SMQ73799.1 DNA binding domain-containing protein, excisionase family [Altererythrobacter xiamenensis]